MTNMSMKLTLIVTLVSNIRLLNVASSDIKEQIFELMCDGDQSFRAKMIECLNTMPQMHQIAFQSCGVIHRNDTKGEYDKIIDGMCKDEIYTHNVSDCLHHFFHIGHNHNTSAHDHVFQGESESDSMSFDHEEDHIFDDDHHDFHREMNDGEDYDHLDEEHNEECWKNLYSMHNISLSDSGNNE